MSTAKKTIYAAIGAGSSVFEKARELPQRVVAFPATLSERVGSLKSFDLAGLRSIDLRELPKTFQEQITTVPARASELVDEAKKLADKATERLMTAFSDLSARGETVAKKVVKTSSNGSASKPKAKAATKKAAVSPETVATTA